MQSFSDHPAFQKLEQDAKLQRDVGQRLRFIRQQRGLTMEDVKAVSGYSKASLSGYENGQRKLPIERFLALCLFYETSPLLAFPEDAIPANFTRDLIEQCVLHGFRNCTVSQQRSILNIIESCSRVPALERTVVDA